MRSVDIIMAARAEALFTSELPTGSEPTSADAERAIRDAVRVHGGVRGCAAQMAYGYGDNPEAVAFVRAVRAELLQSGAELRPFA